MQDRAVKQVGDGGQADVRMWPHVETFAGEELAGAHLIEEDERSDHLFLFGRQRAADLEATDVVGTRKNDGFYRIRARGLGLAHDVRLRLIR